MIKYFHNLGRKYQEVALEKTLGLKYLSQQELMYIRMFIKHQKSILDLGIGTGRITNELLLKKNKVTAIDGADSMLEYCSSKFSNFIKSGKLDLIKHDLEKPLPFPDNVYDQIFCIRVFKYVKNWQHCIKETTRVVKKDGVIIIEFSNLCSYESISNQINKLLNIHFHLNQVSEINAEFKKQGFEKTSEMFGPKLPHFVYRLPDSLQLMRFIPNIENLLRIIFGRFFSRTYICVYQKKL
jgi:ubiquinone/menaquinone biosynthesis C-methylase UbiE